MSYEIWWDYFDEDPFEKIGRYVTGAFGHKIIVEMPRISWAYLDWLDATEGSDDDRLFIDNDRIHVESEGAFHDWMEDTVKTLFLRRERAGSPRPPWLPAADPSEFVDI